MEVIKGERTSIWGFTHVQDLNMVIIKYNEFPLIIVQSEAFHKWICYYDRGQKSQQIINLRKDKGYIVIEVTKENPKQTKHIPLAISPLQTNPEEQLRIRQKLNLNLKTKTLEMNSIIIDVNSNKSEENLNEREYHDHYASCYKTKQLSCDLSEVVEFQVGQTDYVESINDAATTSIMAKAYFQGIS